MMVLMGLGPFRFYCQQPSFQELERSTEYDWIAQRRVARDIAHQYIGPGEDRVTLKGRLYPLIFGGLEMLDRMRLAGRAGQLMDLAAVNGVVFGQFFIKSVSETQKYLNPDGVPHMVDFDLTLFAYGSDADGFGGALF